MKLRGVEFGNVLAASGVQGFFGEGYWFHPLLKPFGLDFSDVTFVSKTATLLSRKSNVSLNRDYKLRWPLPRCIRAKPLKGLMLNAIGLSNPGLGALLGTGQWQEREEPFFISIMPVAETPWKRLEEIRIMMDMLEFCQDKFKAKFGLQINLSCQNTEHDPAKLISEAERILNIAGQLGVPVMPKFGIDSAPVEAVAELQGHPNCDAICVSNAIRFGWEEIDWNKTWGSKVSPLTHLGGGALSGKELLPFVCAWISRLRKMGFTKPINGGGGILSFQDIYRYHEAGASSVFVSSVATLRPWRVHSIVQIANSIWWQAEEAHIA